MIRLHQISSPIYGNLQGAGPGSTIMGLLFAGAALAGIFYFMGKKEERGHLRGRGRGRR